MKEMIICLKKRIKLSIKVKDIMKAFGKSWGEGVTVNGLVVPVLFTLNNLSLQKMLLGRVQQVFVVNYFKQNNSNCF